MKKKGGKSKRGGRAPGKFTPSRDKRRRRNLLGRFGPYLRKRREERNLTIREFAKRAGIPHSNLFQFEALAKNPRLTELEQIARVFDEKVHTFIKPVVEPVKVEPVEVAPAPVVVESMPESVPEQTQ